MVELPGLTAPAAPAYVALGDSRAAAPTPTSAQHPDGCGRTRDAYPTHLASRLRMSYTSVACVNATTADVTTRRQATPFGARPVQINALSWSTRLVTLSIGGNDLRWWCSSDAAATYNPAGCPARPTSATPTPHTYRPSSAGVMYSITILQRGPSVIIPIGAGSRS
ncbi:GDSL-type esterase/lipase family protein [Gordonia sp. IITR100]|uniref:GDSL-type esterase/lipase family protein n=1 Tax=Gordonia sp. IITR100 TaxID=1314686 RepID=UPI0020CA7FD9|nr:GDSL-type esterase/lipase family protein [Gordonia sp. IITR100]